MCTLVILRRPEHDWPLIVAGNRDESFARAWAAPGRHWCDRPEVVAGLDRAAGGSWFGVNDHGVLAVVTNREQTLGPAAHRRSRGELVLEALDHAEADAAAGALAELDPAAYRGFNLFVGDPQRAYWLCHRDDGNATIEAHEIGPGLHLLTARDLDDMSVPRIRDFLPRFRQAPPPEVEAGDWRAWRALLAERSRGSGGDAAMLAPTFDAGNGFGTVCSQLAAVPRFPGAQRKPVLLFAPGPPDRVPFEPVAL